MIRLRSYSKPVFDSVLDDLGARSALDEETVGGSFLNGGIYRNHSWALTFAESAPSIKSSRPRRRPYHDDEAGAAPAYPPLSLDEEQIYLDLGLSPNLSMEDVAALRRQFALRNHPDRVTAEYRDIATRRMMVANAVCDRYLLVNEHKP
jgi:hypothetical protein